MEVKCNYCGKIKERTPYNVKRSEHLFCSNECYNKWVRASEVRKGKKISSFPLLNNKEWIYDKYWTDDMTLKEIADTVGCSVGAVWRAFKRLKISKRKTYGQKGKDSNLWKGGKIKVQCKTCGKRITRDPSLLKTDNFCSPECYAESLKTFPLLNDKEWLTNKYWNECKKTHEIMEIIGCSRSAVLKAFHKLGITQRENERARGEDNHNWKGGTSFAPYCSKFNEAFKESVREEFCRVCFLCPKTEEENGKKLSVHHVNYNKDCLCGDTKCEFVPLCSSCHSKTNYNREYWENLILSKLSNGQTIIDAFATLI